jgi:hypothetical protein
MAWLTGWCILIPAYLCNLVSTNCNTFSSKLYHVNVLTVHAMTVCRRNIKFTIIAAVSGLHKLGLSCTTQTHPNSPGLVWLNFTVLKKINLKTKVSSVMKNSCLRNEIIFKIINDIFSFNIQCMHTTSLYVQGQTVCEMKGIISYIYGSTTFEIC